MKNLLRASRKPFNTLQPLLLMVMLMASPASFGETAWCQTCGDCFSGIPSSDPMPSIPTESVLGNLYKKRETAQAADAEVQTLAPEGGGTPPTSDARMNAIVNVSQILTDAPLEETFKLHSNPNARRTLFINWYSHNPADYTVDQLNFIRATWAHVAEDYFPFDVNVTTETPPPGDLGYAVGHPERFGHTVDVKTGSNSGYSAGKFRSAKGDVSTVFTSFTNSLFTGLAISHEAGHSFGLYHDGYGVQTYYGGHGSGDMGWAPMMGNGSRNVSQWSKGEYHNATRTQDDVAMIGAVVGWLPDLAGDSIAQSAMLNLDANGLVDQKGRIETREDVDIYRFVHGGGNLLLNIGNADIGANLDVGARLYGAAGNLIAESNSDSSLDAGFNLNLVAGEYFIAVEGVGAGNPLNDPPTGWTDYGSLGYFRITGSVIPHSGSDTTAPSISVHADDLQSRDQVTHWMRASIEDIGFVDISTLGNTDFRIQGPNGYDQAATLVALDATSDRTRCVGIYEFSGPGGNPWTELGNGIYQIVVQGGEIADVSGPNPVATAIVGTFEINVPPQGVSVPFYDGFESGQLNGDWWSMVADPSEIYISSGQNVPSGLYAAGMQHLEGSNQMELVLSADLLGQSNVHLAFGYQKKVSYGNALYLSVDGGLSWQELLDFSTDAPSGDDWHYRMIDLDAVVIGNGHTYSSDTRLRFATTIYGTPPNHGLMIDNVTLFRAEPANGLPVGNNDSYATDEDQILSRPAATGVLANDTDPDGDQLYAFPETLPANGSLKLHADGAFSYTPAPHFHGVDSFTYKLFDQRSASWSSHTVEIAVASVADAATGLALSAYSIRENAANGSLVGTVQVIDPDAGDAHVLALLDDAGGRFQLDGDLVKVADTDLLDANLATTHTIRIRATGTVDGLIHEQDIVIGIIRVQAPSVFEGTILAGQSIPMSTHIVAVDSPTGQYFEFTVPANTPFTVIATPLRYDLDIELRVFDDTGAQVDHRNEHGVGIVEVSRIAASATNSTYAAEVRGLEGLGQCALRIVLGAQMELEMESGDDTGLNTFPASAQDLQPLADLGGGERGATIVGKRDTFWVHRQKTFTGLVHASNSLVFDFEGVEAWGAPFLPAGDGRLRLTARGNFSGADDYLDVSFEGYHTMRFFETDGLDDTPLSRTASLSYADWFQDMGADNLFSVAFSPSPTVADVAGNYLDLEFSYPTVAEGDINQINYRDIYSMDLVAGESITLEMDALGGQADFSLGYLNNYEIETQAHAVIEPGDTERSHVRNFLCTQSGKYLIIVEAGIKRHDYLIGVRVKPSSPPAGKVQVVHSSISDGQQYGTAPSRITLEFDRAMKVSSIDPSELLLDGAGVSGVSWIDGDTLGFDLPASLTAGVHTLSLADGVWSALDGGANDPWSITFELGAFDDLLNYEQWAVDHQLPSLGFRNGDYDKDSLSNEMEFAFGFDPMIKDGAMSRVLRTRIVEDAGSRYLEIEFSHPAGLHGVTYRPWTSDSLQAGSWLNELADPSLIRQSSQVDGIVTEVVRYATPIHMEGKRFMKLEVIVAE